MFVYRSYLYIVERANRTPVCTTQYILSLYCPVTISNIAADIFDIDIAHDKVKIVELF